MSEGPTRVERETLLQRLAMAEAKAQECQVEAAVYRGQLIECERLAREAISTENPSLLHGALSRASLTLEEGNAKKWAKNWKDVWEADVKWLNHSIRALKQIKRAASQLSVDNQQDAPLKAEIIEQATDALVQYVASSVSTD